MRNAMFHLPESGTAGDASATDNCDATPTVTYEGEVSTKTNNGTCTDQNYTLTRTWKAVDDCGNTATKSQTITVSDNTVPVFTFVPASTTAQCNAVPSIGTPTATDNCDPSVSVTYNGQTSTQTSNGSCTDNSYTITRKWTATDNCSNTTSASQTITVNDDVAPSITAPAATEVKCASLVPAGITYYSTFVSAGGQPVIIAVERLRSASVMQPHRALVQISIL